MIYCQRPCSLADSEARKSVNLVGKEILDFFEISLAATSPLRILSLTFFTRVKAGSGERVQSEI
jgi:hypothetical protein